MNKLSRLSISQLYSVIALCLSLVSFIAFAESSLFNSSSSNSNTLPFQSKTFLPGDQAFQFDFTQKDSKLQLSWQIKTGYYLYRQRIELSADQATFEPPELPEGIAHNDAFFGDSFIYKNKLVLPINLLTVKDDNAILSVVYQGCADDGFCYPPETKEIPLSKIAQSVEAPTPKIDNVTSAQIESAEQTFASQLKNSKWAPLLFLILGIGLAFTPCVLPMYPIITSLVLGQGERTLKQTFIMSFVYVQGMALTYASLGLVVASLGLEFQIMLQQPSIIIILACLFILLSASMFGAYTLQLPASLQTRLISISNQQSGGKYIGVLIMGMISGLVCSPCVTAPLSGALLYVAQSGDYLVGALTLYSIALGMGIPLILVALFGKKILPTSGDWMNQIKIFFGFVLLSAALLLLNRLLQPLWVMQLWTLLLFSIVAWLFTLYLKATHRKEKLIMALLTTSFIIITAVSSYQLSLDVNTEKKHSLPFISVKTLTGLKEELQQAQIRKEFVMLDFYADWCVACKEFEKDVFSQPEIQTQLKTWRLLQIDATKLTDEHKKIFKQLDILGLPTITFWNKKGEPLNNQRITGFLAKKEFLKQIELITGKIE